MAEIIAKSGAEYKNVLNQNDNIVEQLDLATIEAIDFTPSHKLEDEEWFRISNFSNQDYSIDECINDFSTASLTQIANDEYRGISAICIIQGNQKHFQRITPTRFVDRKKILDYSGQPSIIEHRNQIEIKSVSDAIYLSQSDTLYFKSISLIKSIFPGIEILHREATQEEVDAFLGNEFIALENYIPEKVGAQNRKRIADIGNKYRTLNEDKRQRLIVYARDKSGIDLQDEAFVVRSEGDLKKLLYAMDQRYYFADIYEEERVANSVRVIVR